jgi:hypothetical protein
MKEINRKDLENDDLYGEIMRKESHHDHKIIDCDGRPRWKEDPKVSELVEAMGGLNNIVRFFFAMGITKNDEVWRKLYRDIGYSLYGYWEIFYWEMNNEDAADYRSDC